MQKDNFPKIPPLPHITGKELFEDDKKAEEWFHALTLRRAALANLIASTQASHVQQRRKSGCGRVCHRVAVHRWRIPIPVNEV